VRDSASVAQMASAAQLAASAERGRKVALVLLLTSVILLLPGLGRPVLTISGVLQPEALAQMAPELLEAGVGESAVNQLKSMLNPSVTGLVALTGGDLRGIILGKLKSWLQSALKESALGRVEVYTQTRSIAGSIEHLFVVGSWTPAVLILLFSVVVPCVKAALLLAALLSGDAANRLRLVGLVESAGKWSMADVFVVGLFVAFLAAQASPTEVSAQSLVTFEAHLGAGFYFFTAYCLVSLAASHYARTSLPLAAAHRPYDV